MTTAPIIAPRALSGAITSGRATTQAMSASAIWATSCPIVADLTPTDWSIGSTSAPEEEARSTP
jgi:hypothetical protein